MGILIVRKVPKTSGQNFSQHSNSTSFVGHYYKLHFSNQSINEELFSCKNLLNGNIVDFVVSIRKLTYRISKNCCFNCFISLLELLILQKQRIRIFHLGLCRMLKAFGDPSKYQTIHFSLASEF